MLFTNFISLVHLVDNLRFYVSPILCHRLLFILSNVFGSRRLTHAKVSISKINVAILYAGAFYVLE